MRESLIIPNELFTSFSDITYYDEPHKYYVNGKELISVTTIIHKYQEPFNEEYWSQAKATQYGLSVREVLRAWNFINKKGTMKGSAIHDYSENIFQNKVFDYPKQMIVNEFGFDPVLLEYNVTKKHVDKFYNDTKDKLIPIKTEYVVYDGESLIGGMLDMLFYNVKAKEFQIWDWKTNKEFDKESKYGNYLSGDLCTIQDSDLEIYSLQLSLYKLIIEKNTGIKLGDSYIVWFSHNNPTYEIIKVNDRRYHAEIIMNDRIKEIKGL